MNMICMYSSHLRLSQLHSTKFFRVCVCVLFSVQPTVCKNPNCANRRRFMLDINQSRFVDFQKVRVQETQQELPRGSIPRSLEVVLRAEAVEMVQAGDKCDFIGTLIAVPDVAQLAMESGCSLHGKSRTLCFSVVVFSGVGARSETSTRVRKADGYNTDGVRYVYM